MPRLVIIGVLAAVLMGVSTASAAQHAESEASLEDIRRAVVGVLAQIPPTARTARFLGTSREGSGVLIDNEGYILTIGYVVLEAEKVEIVDSEGKRLPAYFVGYDAATGFGLLRSAVPLKGPPLKIGLSRKLSAQDPVLVVTFGAQSGIVPAVVASRRTFAGYWEYLLEEAIFTIPPTRGFAGAALVDKNFELVGIGSLFIGDVAGDESGVPGNMFVPIDKLKPILADLKRNGRSAAPPRPWLGVFLQERFGRVFVSNVARGGPAHKAGVHPGDIILQLNGTRISDMSGFYRRLWGLGNAGINVDMQVLQGSQINSLRLHSSDRYDNYKMPTLR